MTGVQTCALPISKLAQQVRDVELHGALGDIHFIGDFLVGKILEERIEAFLFAAAEMGDGVRLEAAPLTREDGINEAREHGARNQKTAIGHEGKGALKLFSRLDVGEKA